MKRSSLKILSLLLALTCFAGVFCMGVGAEEITDEAVLEVIEQLESIDSLATMQSKWYDYTVKNNHYDTGTTDTAVAQEHQTARESYESYRDTMFAARAAAKSAYEALSDGQKAQVPSELVAKLTDTLSTEFDTATYPVTPAEDEYTFEAVKGGAGYGYEVSNYMVSGEIPQTFILVDTSDGKTEWTPNGHYVYGQSNYEVLYCCDVLTSLEYTTDYKRVNLEDSNYYSEYSADKIRAILLNSYPYVAMDEMKANLIAGGLSEDFVNGLNRSHIISAVQMAVWTYANADTNDGPLGYFASVSVPKNTGIYFTALHDFSNEIWDWLPGKRQRSYNPEAEYVVNTLAYYLCNLEGIPATPEEKIVSDVKVTRADLVEGSTDTYYVGLYVNISNGGTEADDLKVNIVASHVNEDGTVEVTSRNSQAVKGRGVIPMSIRARSGDTVKVTVSGTMSVGKNVYFYTPKGGRDVSQSLVGVGEGVTSVCAETEFVFEEDMGEFGIRIYKTETDSGDPISDITFTVYNAYALEGEALGATPTEDDIARLAVEENRVATLVTDISGYAGVTVEPGTYLIIEEENPAKVKAPVDPFFIQVPMNVEEVDSEGNTIVVSQNVVSLYPKNEPPETPPPPPPPPPPETVKGQFEIIKHDSENTEKLLSGAEFALYAPVFEGEDFELQIVCDGVKLGVVPVEIDGVQVKLVTDENGRTTSPELLCGSYYLVETKAPAGYNLDENAVHVRVQPDAVTEISYVYVANERGSILPETGGMGTKILIISGGVLVVGAAILLVTRRRMREN